MVFYRANLFDDVCMCVCMFIKYENIHAIYGVHMIRPKWIQLTLGVVYCDTSYGDIHDKNQTKQRISNRNIRKHNVNRLVNEQTKQGKGRKI